MSFPFQYWLLATTPLRGGNHTGSSKIPGGLAGGLMGKRPLHCGLAILYSSWLALLFQSFLVKQ